MRYVIGVDCGTTNVKVVLFNDTGKEIMTESVVNRPEYSGTFIAEMDMDVLWMKTAACIKKLLETGPADKKQIAAVGITGQGEGLWLIDDAGKPVQKAILWCDARASEEVAVVCPEKNDIGRLIHRTTGTPPLEGTQLMLLKWMSDHKREVLDRASTCFFCKDWIRFKLSGKISADWTDSGTSLLDVESGKVSLDVLEKLGLDIYRRIIPDPVVSSEFCAEVSPVAATQTGLRSGTPIIAGALDVSATAVGVGAINEHDCCVILGTTCANEEILRKEHCKFGMPGSRYEKHPLGDLYISLQPTMNGTPNLDWTMRELVGTEDFGKMQDLLASEPVGARGVLYLPYIGMAGERSPFHNPYARAGFFGLNVQSTKATLVRAVYEGISLSVRDCLCDIDRSGTMYLAGGGAKDPVWSQLIADVMGMSIRIFDTKELGAKGIALMALVGLGFFKTYGEAVGVSCTYKAEYHPDLRNTEKYDRLYGLFRQLREMHMPLWNVHHDLQLQQ